MYNNIYQGVLAMNEYVLKLCKKYNITMSNDSLKLFSDLFQTVEFVEGTDASIEIENQDYLHSVVVRYGKNKDNMIRIYIHIWKYVGEPGYRIYFLVLTANIMLFTI